MISYKPDSYYQRFRLNRRNRRIQIAMSAAAIVLAIAVVFAAVAKATSDGTSATGDGVPIGSNVGQAVPMRSADGVDGTEGQPDAQSAEIVMTIAGDKDTYVIVGEEYIEAGCHAAGPSVGNVTGTVVVEGDVDTAHSGVYDITYTATAPDGSSATAIRHVNVVESFDAFDGAAQNLPVLMYHYVYSEADPPADLNGNYILDTKLAEQCAYLHDNNYYYPSFEEVRAWVDGAHTLPARSVVLTFDDGEAGFLKHGISILNQYEVPATSFLIGKDAGSVPVDFANPYVQFQSHGYDMHRAGGDKGQGGIIYALSKEEIVADINASNQAIGPSVALAYPFGDNDENAQEAVGEAGIICAFTVKNGRVEPGDNPLALNRVRISGEYSLSSFINLVQPNA